MTRLIITAGVLSLCAACATAAPSPATTTIRTGSGNPIRVPCNGADCGATAAPPVAAPTVAARLHLGWPVWIGVVCDDLEAQRRFYRDVLGMREWDVGEGWIWFELDGKLFELLARSDRPEYAQRGVTVGFLVDDIQSARATLIERGAQPVGGIQGDSSSSWAYFKDSDGTLFEITSKHGVKPPATSAHGAAETHAKP